jgi:hypothetical protein
VGESLDDQWAIVLREKIARGRIAARLANVPRCLIGIEAGTATHYVARELSALGHDVKQVPPAYSKPSSRAISLCCPTTGTLSIQSTLKFQRATLPVSKGAPTLASLAARIKSE